MNSWINALMNSWISELMNWWTNELMDYWMRERMSAWMLTLLLCWGVSFSFFPLSSCPDPPLCEYDVASFPTRSHHICFRRVPHGLPNEWVNVTCLPPSRNYVLLARVVVGHWHVGITLYDAFLKCWLRVWKVSTFRCGLALYAKTCASSRPWLHPLRMQYFRLAYCHLALCWLWCDPSIVVLFSPCVVLVLLRAAP